MNFNSKMVRNIYKENSSFFHMTPIKTLITLEQRIDYLEKEYNRKLFFYEIMDLKKYQATGQPLYLNVPQVIQKH